MFICQSNILAFIFTATPTDLKQKKILCPLINTIFIKNTVMNTTFFYSHYQQQGFLSTVPKDFSFILFSFSNVYFSFSAFIYLLFCSKSKTNSTWRSHLANKINTQREIIVTTLSRQMQCLQTKIKNKNKC